MAFANFVLFFWDFKCETSRNECSLSGSGRIIIYLISSWELGVCTSFAIPVSYFDQVGLDEGLRNFFTPELVN